MTDANQTSPNEILKLISDVSDCAAEPIGDIENVEIELSTTEEEKEKTW